MVSHRVAMRSRPVANVQAADLIQRSGARIAALARLAGKQALELEFLKGGSALRTAAETCALVRDRRPSGFCVPERGRLMAIWRSSCHDAPKRAADATALVEAMDAIKDASEAQGWRRMQAALGWRQPQDAQAADA